MRHSHTLRHISFALFLFAFLFPADAYAYLDPGTGSLVVQAVVAGIAAGAYMLRSYWRRIGALFGRRDPAASGESGDSQAE